MTLRYFIELNNVIEDENILDTILKGFIIELQNILLIDNKNDHC